MLDQCKFPSTSQWRERLCDEWKGLHSRGASRWHWPVGQGTALQGVCRCISLLPLCKHQGCLAGEATRRCQAVAKKPGWASRGSGLPSGPLQRLPPQYRARADQKYFLRYVKARRALCLNEWAWNSPSSGVLWHQGKAQSPAWGSVSS